MLSSVRELEPLRIKMQIYIINVVQVRQYSMGKIYLFFLVKIENFHQMVLN